MASDSHDVLADGAAEWQRAEQAVSRLIAAHHNLTRDDNDAERAPGSEHPATPAAPVAAQATPVAAAQSHAARWMTVVLLAALWIAIGLVVSAAILSVAMLL